MVSAVFENEASKQSLIRPYAVMANLRRLSRDCRPSRATAIFDLRPLFIYSIRWVQRIAVCTLTIAPQETGIPSHGPVDPTASPHEINQRLIRILEHFCVSQKTRPFASCFKIDFFTIRRAVN